MVNARLEEWKLVRKQKEKGVARLEGQVLNHPEVPHDGKPRLTDRLIALDWKARRATVEDGTVFDLGQPDPEWVHWLGTRGVNLDDIMTKEWKN